MKSKIIAILGMVATLLIAYGLDYWVESSQHLAERTFNYAPLLWGAGLANLLLVSVFLLLAWLVQVRMDRSKLVASVFFVIGIMANFAIGIWASLPSLAWPFDPTPFLAPTSHLALAGAFILALGVITFFPRSRKVMKDER